MADLNYYLTGDWDNVWPSDFPWYLEQCNKAKESA